MRQGRGWIALQFAAATAAGTLLAAGLTACSAGQGTGTDTGPTSTPWAAPYYYLGVKGPPPADVMKATGIRHFTLAFIVSNGPCHPAWDGSALLAGGPGQAAIRDIRAVGGDVAVSFGGIGGGKLAVTCANSKARAQGWTLRYPNWRQGFSASLHPKAV